MGTTLTLEQITNKLSHLEDEVDILRKELAELRQQKRDAPTKSNTQITYAWVDKEFQRHWMNQLFASLPIISMPINPQILQQRMMQSGLSLDELSRGIIEAREE